MASRSKETRGGVVRRRPSICFYFFTAAPESERVEEREQVGLLARAERVESRRSARALAGVRQDRSAAVGGPAVVQQLVADVETPERRGPHALRNRHGIAVVADVIAERSHVVDEE